MLLPDILSCCVSMSVSFPLPTFTGAFRLTLTIATSLICCQLPSSAVYHIFNKADDQDA